EALQDVSFAVERGSAVGVIGPNGSGKTTLVKLIAGVMKPDAGRVKVRGSVIPLLSLGVGFHPDLTGRENVKISGLILGLHPAEIEERMDEIAAFAELEDFIDAPVHTYSNGMYMRLAFSLGINVDPDILLLDEVFAVGDAAFAAKCRDQMKRFKNEGTTVLLVSHDLETVAQFCDTVLWLDRGRIRQIGPAAEVVDAYRRDVGVS
ncbi:MAG: ABC transporter ATP-binding protein, partial [Acidobacteriaceae bacterium]|nr:ABC transporter ATP-binding protein [Acidobacteriaceae bacterium]